MGTFLAPVALEQPENFLRPARLRGERDALAFLHGHLLRRHRERVARLHERKTESDDGLSLRIATARQELKRIEQFDYVVVNREDELMKTVDQVLSIIRAEKCRVDWTPVNL